MAHLTREQMEQVIRGGGSVKHGGRIISTVEGLPSKADLAKGDPAKERAAAGDLQAQIDQLQQQLAGLQASQGQQEGPAEAELSKLSPEDRAAPEALRHPPEERAKPKR